MAVKNRLSRGAILGQQLRTLDVDVPEWGGSVQVRELSLLQQQMISASAKGGDNGSVAVKTFLEGVIDPQFNAADAEALVQTGIAAFQRVVNAILELSGMTDRSKAQIAGK